MPHPQLSKEQLVIVLSDCPRIQVDACPGSGKTTTLIACIKHWVEEGADPASILVLSFSNAAVANVEAKLMEQGLQGLNVSTIHALGLQLIPDKPTVLTERERLELVRRAIRAAAKNVAHDWPVISETRQRFKANMVRKLLSKKRALLHLISVCSALDHDHDGIKDLARARFGDVFKCCISVLSMVLKHYDLAKREAGVLDYGDMVALATKHVKRSDAKWTHILVDEQQDCTAAQGVLVTQLVRTTRAMFRSFGDPAQAIFGFAGSGGVNFQDLMADCELMTLTQSQRLPQRIAALATAVGELPSSSAIVSRRPGGTLSAITCESEIDMAMRVCTLVKQQLAEKPEGRIAVLARTKAQIYRIDQALRAQGIWATPTPRGRYAVASALQWTDRMARLDDASVPMIERYLRSRRLTIVSAKVGWTAKLLHRGSKCTSISGGYRQAVNAYVYAHGSEMTEEERKALRNDLMRWQPYASKAVSPRAMWDEIRKMKKSHVGQVHLSTIHASKGLEWDTVIVVGVTEGVLPIRYAKDDWALEQERNLLYVAVTRAKGALHLFHAPTCWARTGEELKDWSSIFTKRAAHLIPMTKSQRLC
ncbi:ATP-dependent helicase [Comamonas sp. MYb21]|uniref:ATP-dependent helicase n=1 Tax=Comamonas sp. MYb21 TaxID=1848648 RepID=UPI0030B580AA